jgi:hypothetical protein
MRPRREVAARLAAPSAFGWRWLCLLEFLATADGVLAGAALGALDAAYAAKPRALRRQPGRPPSVQDGGLALGCETVWHVRQRAVAVDVRGPAQLQSGPSWL